MTCKNCGQRLTLVHGEYWAVKYQGEEGLIDGSTRSCFLRGKEEYSNFGMIIPHQPSKNSIVIDILKDL